MDFLLISFVSQVYVKNTWIVKNLRYFELIRLLKSQFIQRIWSSPILFFGSIDSLQFAGFNLKLGETLDFSK